MGSRFRSANLPRPELAPIAVEARFVIGPAVHAGRLDALLVAADTEHSFLLSGGGELIEADDGIVAIGSGGNFALAAARAQLDVPHLSAREVVQRSLEIAADICVFSNRNITILEL